MPRYVASAAYKHQMEKEQIPYFEKDKGTKFFKLRDYLLASKHFSKVALQ